MVQTDMISLILAGGKGTRLGALTSDTPKPSVFYGGDYRIIDFTISNCINSGFQTIAVLTHYLPDKLHRYIDDLNNTNRFADIPIEQWSSERDNAPYLGTADAVFKNIDLIDSYNPEHVLILSGDQIYKMDYAKMLQFHKETQAAVTIAATSVPWSNTHQYGILSCDPYNKVIQFKEKPKHSTSNLASMGIYIFNWKTLKNHLIKDNYQPYSSHDFGENIIPDMLAQQENVYTYTFEGYWRNINTIHELWAANMDLLGGRPKFQISDYDWHIYSAPHSLHPYYYYRHKNISNSLISKNCEIEGTVKNSIVSGSVYVGPGAEVTDSVLMPGVVIGSGVIINKAVIGANTKIQNGVKIGVSAGANQFADKYICQQDISLVAPRICLHGNISLSTGSFISAVTPVDVTTQQFHVTVQKKSTARRF